MPTATWHQDRTGRGLSSEVPPSTENEEGATPPGQLRSSSRIAADHGDTDVRAEEETPGGSLGTALLMAGLPPPGDLGLPSGWED